MKIYRIFIKNLLVVSRNWGYFILLFLCPLFLIIVSGIMLNSADFSNVQIGVINQDSNEGFSVGLEEDNCLKDFENKVGSENYFNSYESLDDCISAFESSIISGCIHARKEGDIQQLDIYLDNKRKSVEYYARQFILNKVLSEQTCLFEQTKEEMNSKINFYTISISDYQNEVEGFRVELKKQENVLVDYKRDLGDIRTDFDETYSDLKGIEPQMISLRTTLDQNPEIEQQTPELRELVDRYFEILKDLEDLEKTLDKLDSDLDDSVEKIQENQVKMEEIKDRLGDVKTEINEFSEKAGEGKVNINFNQAFNISDDPVLVTFPLIMSMIIIFTSLVLSNMFIVKQINSSSILRDLITPTKDFVFIIANYLTNLFFIFLQVSVLFLIILYWFKVPFSNLYPSFFGVFLVVSLFIFVGMSFGYIIKSPNNSMLITIFFVLFNLLISDLILPFTVFGPFIKFIISLNPFFILSSILSNCIVLGKTSLSYFYDDFFKLGFFLAIMIVACYFSKKVNKRVLMG